MSDIFDPLFEIQDQRLMKLGNPLLELERNIDWESFRSLLNCIHHKERKSNAGAKPKDVVMMFKGIILQDLYGLSDDQLEFQLADRRSFQQFLDLSNHQRPPDAKTFWAFKNQLSELVLTDLLFKQFSIQLEQMGYIARKGQIVDASIIPAPIQRNTREENKQIKQGDIPEDWGDNKGRQKDTDARWTKKNNTNYYGYKNHIQIDNDRKLIRNYSVTPANVHDSQVFEELLDANNTSKDVWADSAYRSEEQEASLKDKGYRSKVQRKGKRNNPLTKQELKGNRTRSKVRSRVEHVFGAQSNLRVKAIRCIGLTRTMMAIGLMNLTYNMRRFCFLQRISAS